MRKKLLYCFVLSMACLPSMAQNLPVADLLDVEFNTDGSAVDISPMKNAVEYVGDGTTIAYSSLFERNVATFNNGWAQKGTGYYVINFEGNEAFESALADGHSLEILVKANYEGAIQDVECKPFSAMQSGGTGFLICKTNASGSGGKNVFTFLPNVSTSTSSTWRWTTSGVTPISGLYYHVIGVWNKEEAKSYIYVNGELCNTIDAPGEFHPASAGCHWFCIGGDASGSGGEACWNGDIGIARVYDKPLSSEEAAALWSVLEKPTHDANLIVYQDIVQEGLEYINGITATQSLLSDYENALRTLETLIQTGTTEELVAQNDIVSTLRPKVEASVTAYLDYKNHVETAITYLTENTDFEGDDRDFIELYLNDSFEPNDDYPHGSYLYIWDNTPLTTEEIREEASWVDEKLRAAIENGIKPGSEITNLLINSSFSDGFNGWKGTVGTAAAKSTTNDMYGAECLGKGFNMYQTLTGLENGVYVLVATAAYRPFNDYTSNYYSAAISMNDNSLFIPTVYETRLPVADAVDGENCYIIQQGSDAAVDVEIFDESTGEVTAYAINGKTSIANAAAGGRAMNYLLTNVTDGSLTVRFADQNSNASSDWTGISNIHLYYLGTLEDAAHYLDETLACMVARAQNIINIVPDTGDYISNPNCPNDVKNRLQAAIAAVATASTPEEKYALVETFSALWKEVVAGRDAYVKMVAEADACSMTVGYMVAAGQIPLEEADKLYEVAHSMWEVFEAGTYTTEEALAMDALRNAGLIPATDENGTYLISSNYDMAYYCQKAGSTTQAVNGKLLADIDYFTEDQMIENFYGTLDGNYHTITVNINRAARGAALINNMQNGSCVKNMTIKGEVSNSDKFVTAVAANSYNICTISGIVSLINGHSTVVDDSGNGGVMSCNRGSLVMKDCVFAGSIEGAAATNSSGIVGWTNGSTVISNCLQIGDLSGLNPSGSSTIARIPESVVVDNCYYKTAFGAVDGTQITDEQLASGEVCYLLNKGNTENPTWFQNIGEDPFPVPNPNHQKVGKKADGTFTNNASEWETVEPQPVETTPKADLFDVVFHEDGTAEDVSPYHSDVVAYGAPTTYYSETYQRYVAKFENAYGTNAANYYKGTDYNESGEIRTAMANGHSLEVLCMNDYPNTIPNSETKPFSAMQGGGTGFLVTTISGARQNELCFLPNITTTGASTWRWTTSGVVPESGVFYHIVGVWNPEEQKTYIYVNGELKNTVAAPGIWKPATSSANWFAIGGDPSGLTTAHGSWNGEVGIARAYSKSLTAEDVAYLWEQVQNPNGIGMMKPEPVAPIGIFRLDGVRVDKAQKGIYIIDGKKTLVK